MARHRLPFTQAAVQRAVNGVKAAGYPITQVDIRPDGSISVLTASTAPVAAPESAFDAWKAKSNARAS